MQLQTLLLPAQSMALHRLYRLYRLYNQQYMQQ